MAYTIEQKLKGRTYLYEVTSYWDKDKKQARQKRKYLGPKDRVYNKGTDKYKDPPKLINKTSNFVSKSYGDTFLIRTIQNELGLTRRLKDHFGDDYKDILPISHYLLQESSPSYLYPFWQEDHFNDNQLSKLNSASISALYERIGRNERKRLEFLRSWSNHINPTSGIYYDITSVSSYSKNIEYLEWGYNRDKENLPQINIGLTHCMKSSLPITYTVHPGSIVDVTTLKNTIKMFELFNMKELFFVLDRGFCSKSNMNEMLSKKMGFIQPLSFSLKMTDELIMKHQNEIKKGKKYV